MTADPKFLAAYKNATKQNVEKRDITDELQKSGDPSFLKEMETFLRSLGINYAGGVPNSLLARQDLEGTTKMALAKSQVSKDGSSSLSVWYYDDAGNQKCEVHQNIVDAEAAVKRLKELKYKDVHVVSSNDMSKAGDMMYCVRTNGMEYFRTSVKADAEEMLATLTAQGQFAVLIQEKIMGAEKGQVETTGKQLDHAVVSAQKAEDTEEKDDLATRIKNIQLKRQSATIAERSKEVGKTSKNFKAEWQKLMGRNKN